MIRVVLDTNVFVSSFFGGNPRKIVDLWKTGEVTLCLSGPIIEEYVEVLGRLGLQEEKELGELLRLFAYGYDTIYVSRTPELQVVHDDPDDNKFVECAVALDADFIVSGDKALLAVQDYMGIKIVNPKGLLTALDRR